MAPRAPTSSGARAPHLEAGDAAERLACDFLSRRGLSCLARNYRCRSGEIDLVMLEGDCVVVVEVRYRATTGRVSPIESITREKQRRLARAALHWLTRNPGYADRPLRFDIVAMSGPLDAATIDWRRAALEFDDAAW